MPCSWVLGGAITKFCYKKLRMTWPAVELNPRGADVPRAWPPAARRRAPARGALDAAEEIRRDGGWAQSTRWRSIWYDDETAAPVLDSAAFSMPTAGAC